MADDVARAESAALDEIATPLYAVAPTQFTAARNAAAGRAPVRLATRVKALRKPTVAAYAVNLLARAPGSPLGEALELAGSLRDAQEALDGPELARLGRQRRALIAALAGQAAALSADSGVPVSASARADIERTLHAAISDPGAAAAVRTGRLVRALEATGLEPADLAGAVAGSLEVTDAVTVDAGSGATSTTRDDLARRRARREADRRLREAERAAADAERAARRAASAADTARGRADDAAGRVAELEAQLARERNALDRAQAEAERREAERADAGAAAASARTAVDDARKAREAL